MHLELFPAGLATQVAMLALAFVLSASIGAERQRRLKSAGLRTHTLVGLGAAAFTLVSAHGFPDVTAAHIALDPSRIAAQIVSGIGFLGAGVIFVRQNVVNGLTTAASIWMTAAIGMACGAGLPILAVCATLLQLLAVTLLPLLGQLIPTVDKGQVFVVRYEEARGILRDVLRCATALGYESSLTDTERIEAPGKAPQVQAHMRFHAHKRGPVADLIEALSEIQGVVSVQLTREENE